MAAIRYGIAGQPVEHSLSPLLVALVARHLDLAIPESKLTMELVEVDTLPDALAWGYAGAVPEPIPWAYTNAVLGKFRTKALLKRAVDAASQVVETHAALGPKKDVVLGALSKNPHLPTRMFDEEIWLNLTAPLKHQLDSGAVAAVDDSMNNKSVNALRWDGRGWWCAGVDGDGVVEVMAHHGFAPDTSIIGIIGGGGAARSTAAAWSAEGGMIHQLPSRRDLEDGPWTSFMTEEAPNVVVDFDNTPLVEGDCFLLKSTYGPMEGGMSERVEAITENGLDGRWLLVAQHLACWRKLWAPERSADLPSLGLLLTQLLEAECVLATYT